MNYVGIDAHKRYSVCAAQDSEGREVGLGRVTGNSALGFSKFMGSLEGPSKVVIEACWNWSLIHDRLASLPQVEEVILAHPLKTRLIADAQIKTDKIDARALASLLRAGLIPPAHIPSPQTRARKNELRQRLYFARVRTMVRNRIHALLARQEELSLPQASDPFGVKSLKAMGELQLGEPDGRLLRELLELHAQIDGQMKAQEKLIRTNCAKDEDTRIMMSLPGMGAILASVAANEIDGIARFPRNAKLCAYCGLVPTTHASGGRVYQGRLLKQCNKWLRWAFVEAAWVAVGCSPYFGQIYRDAKDRGKKPNCAILIVAHRMCQIAWRLLTERRAYRPAPEIHKNFPGRSECTVAVVPQTAE